MVIIGVVVVVEVCMVIAIAYQQLNTSNTICDTKRNWLKDFQEFKV